MFEYFPNNYTWSLAVMSALNRGGQISEIDEACRPLRSHAGADNGPLVVDIMADWVAEQLGGSVTGA